MTSGDEPMVSQPQSSDDAPMLSGALSKAVADARGAYLAGNLRALINRMHEAQQLRLKQAAVRLLLWYAEKLLELGPGHPVERQSLDTVRRWLHNPTADNAAEPLQILLDAGIAEEVVEEFPEDAGIDSYSYYAAHDSVGAVVLRVAEVILAANTFKAAQRASSGATLATHAEEHLVGKPEPHFPSHNVERAAWRWLLDAAWAILQGRETPPVGDVIKEGPEGAYRSEDLGRLVSYMTSTQRLRFKQALIRQAVTYAESALPVDEEYSAEHQIMETARRWLKEPTRAIAREAARLFDSYSIVDTKLLEVQASAQNILDAIRLYNEVRIVSLVRSVARNTLALTGVIVQLNRPDDQPTLDWWQVEAAWAILHNQEPPPFPDLTTWGQRS